MTLKVDITKTSSFELLQKKCSFDNALQHLYTGDIISANQNLAGADNVITNIGKEYRLKEALSGVKNYDYVIIDTPPMLNILTINALIVSTSIVIPVQADTYSVQGVVQNYNN